MNPGTVTPRAAERLRGDTLALVLAGGRGRRLGKLTADRPKAAMPFGGHFRAVDFALSNCVNSAIRRIALLTQYKSQSLIRHVQSGWGFLHSEIDEFIDIWPAQQHRGERWYSSPVDAVQQNIELIAEAEPDYVLVLAGDQIYTMDYSNVIDEHIESGADVTLACAAMPAFVAESASHPIVNTDAAGRIARVALRASERRTAESQNLSLVGDGAAALAAMGVYVFNAQLLLERLSEACYDVERDCEFATDLLPALQASGAHLHAHIFSSADGHSGYWRDIDTADRYWRAHMELLDDPSPLDVSDPNWPIFTHRKSQGPTQFSASARVQESIIGSGCEVAGEVVRSTLSGRCRVGRGASVRNCVLLPGARVGAGCSLANAIVDSNCVVPDGTTLSPANAAERGLPTTPEGIVLVCGTPLNRPSPRPMLKRKVA